LPDALKERLLTRRDQRISDDGVIVIKAQTYRSLEKNREEALRRLRELIDAAAQIQRTRRPTRPTAASKRKRVESKVRRGEIKAARRKVDP
jgi:ribosome-associated protein